MTTRRELILMTCACCAALCADSQADSTSDSIRIDLGPIDDFKPPGLYDQFAKSKKLLVLSTGKRIVVATSRCTHKTCTIKVKEGQLYCPCHKSKFNHDGIPLNGPAKTPLPRHGISIENDRLIADLSKKFEEREWDVEGAYIHVET